MWSVRNVVKAVARAQHFYIALAFDVVSDLAERGCRIKTVRPIFKIACPILQSIAGLASKSGRHCASCNHRRQELYEAPLVHSKQLFPSRGS